MSESKRRVRGQQAEPTENTAQAEPERVPENRRGLKSGGERARAATERRNRPTSQELRDASRVIRDFYQLTGVQVNPLITVRLLASLPVLFPCW